MMVVDGEQSGASSWVFQAGGLDIGSQLAGVRVISSMDFDKDSVETMRSNSFSKMRIISIEIFEKQDWTMRKF